MFVFYYINLQRIDKKANYLINCQKFQGQPILKKEKFVFLASKRPNLATLQCALRIHQPCEISIFQSGRHCMCVCVCVCLCVGLSVTLMKPWNGPQKEQQTISDEVSRARACPIYTPP